MSVGGQTPRPHIAIHIQPSARGLTPVTASERPRTWRVDRPQQSSREVCVMAQPGPSDYRTDQEGVGRRHQHSGGMAEQASEIAGEVGNRVRTVAGDIGATVRERPYTTLAIAAGLAFAVGALWKLGQQRPQSRLDSWLAQLPELPSRDSLLPRRWR